MGDIVAIRKHKLHEGIPRKLCFFPYILVYFLQKSCSKFLKSDGVDFTKLQYQKLGIIAVKTLIGRQKPFRVSMSCYDSNFSRGPTSRKSDRTSSRSRKYTAVIKRKKIPLTIVPRQDGVDFCLFFGCKKVFHSVLDLNRDRYFIKILMICVFTYFFSQITCVQTGRISGTQIIFSLLIIFSMKFLVKCMACGIIYFIFTSFMFSRGILNYIFRKSFKKMIQNVFLTPDQKADRHTARHTQQSNI